MAVHPHELPRQTEFCCPGCGARILARPVKLEGVRHASYRAMETAKAGQAIVRCPRCHRGLPAMTWDEFRDRVGEGFAP